MRSSQPFALPPSPAPAPATHALASPPPLAAPRGAAPPSRPAPAGLAPSSAAQAGLPQLVSLVASCTVDPARPLPSRALSSSSSADDAPSPIDPNVPARGIVDMFGDVSSRESIRATLLRFYEDTQQARAPTKAGAPVDTGVSEMTLRIDTELELLRQQCFAERNAQWDYRTPDMFDFEPVSEPAWTPQLIGNASIAMRRLKHDAPTERDEREAIVAAVANGSYAGVAVPGVGGAGAKVDGKGFPLGQFSRDRPWPPREFTQKAAVRPVRGRGGKRKAPVVVLEERSVFSKICSECQTQATPLWRKLARDGDAWVPVPKTDAATSEPGVAVKADDPAAPAPAPETVAVAGASVPALPTFDVCLACFLKLQRSDLFARKTLERDQRVRERKERAAHEVALEKKRLKQQVQLLKKQQTQSKSKKRRPSVAQEAPAAPAVAAEELGQPTAMAPPTALKLVVKTTDPVHGDSLEHHEDDVDESDQYDARVRVQDADEYDAPPSSRSSASKRERKKSKKSKKEKKKKKRRRVEPIESDVESDCSTPMPSPPQMVGQYEYADRSGSERTRSGRATAALSFDTDDAAYESAPGTEASPQRTVASSKTRTADAPVDAAPRARKTSSRSSERSSSAPAAVTVVTTATSSSTVVASASPPPSPPPSKSRKRKSSIAPVVVPTNDVSDERPKTSARPSRSKATAAAPAPTPLASAARKRTRTKKESARERELRALGQYCPVCNAVYEEDDESTFVCCDSCEMWVHGSCDSTLTPASIAALADSSEKYICPLCAGR